MSKNGCLGLKIAKTGTRDSTDQGNPHAKNYAHRCQTPDPLHPLVIQHAEQGHPPVDPVHRLVAQAGEVNVHDVVRAEPSGGQNSASERGLVQRGGIDLIGGQYLGRGERDGRGNVCPPAGVPGGNPWLGLA